MCTLDQAEALEHETDRALADLGPVAFVVTAHFIVVHEVSAAAWCAEQADDVQQRAFPTTTWPDDGPELTLSNVHAHLDERGGLHGIGAVQVGQVDGIHLELGVAQVQDGFACLHVGALLYKACFTGPPFSAWKITVWPGCRNPGTG